MMERRGKAESDGASSSKATKPFKWVGETKCIKCGPGTKSKKATKKCVEMDQVLKTGSCCEACPAGKTGEPPPGGGIECKLCAEGSFNPIEKQWACVCCPQGKYQENAGQKDCKDCDVGKYNGNPTSGPVQDRVPGFNNVEDCADRG
jgi:hypothetical protein